MKEQEEQVLEEETELKYVFQLLQIHPVGGQPLASYYASWGLAACRL